MIRINGLYKSYFDGSSDRKNDVEVLRDVSLSIAAGESIALMGPSGSGKSTLLNILAGTLDADAGEIEYSFTSSPLDWRSLKQRQRTRIRRQHIGYVHQFFNLIPTLTVLENVCLPGRLNQQLKPPQEMDARALDLLQRFDLAHRLHAFPEVLSGGEQQRVAVARALLLQPAFVLADEPTGNLDAKNSGRVAQLLYESAAENDTTLIIATHSEQVAQLANRTVVLGSNAVQREQ